MRRPALLTILVLLPFLPADAQRQPRRSWNAFGIEALGGTAGSLAGVGAGFLIARSGSARCGTEDLACDLRRITTTGIFSVAGATAGTYLLGRSANTDPSLVGSLLGAIAGAAGGAGVLDLLGNTRLGQHDATLVVAYVLTQGILTAAGSRIGATR